MPDSRLGVGVVGEVCGGYACMNARRLLRTPPFSFGNRCACRGVVKAHGFCSVPMDRLLPVTPAAALAHTAPSAQPATEQMGERRLERCWALVLDLMPVGH